MRKTDATKVEMIPVFFIIPPTAADVSWFVLSFMRCQVTKSSIVEKDETRKT
jgi:hypothetical protein